MRPVMPDWRRLVAGVDSSIPLPDGSRVTSVNFDNSATTPPFWSVLQELQNFISVYASVHRGAGYKSQVSSDFYERARKTVAGFVHADLRSQTVIFVKNTTEAINKLSYRLFDSTKKPVVLSSEMEHHSNDLPWRKHGVDYIAVDGTGRLCLDDLKRKLEKYRGAVKLVAVTGASNVTGYINPVNYIAEVAHGYGAKILIDGAQMVPHFPIDMKPAGSPQHIDFLAFSAHKMYAPFGTGVLIGPKKAFDVGTPEYVGGGTVKSVTREKVVWNSPPCKEEAGTPNLTGVVALVFAIETIRTLGLANIHRYESSLSEYALAGLRNVPGVQLYFKEKPSDPRLGIIPFNLAGVPHSLLARILSDEAGIAVRNGCFCAQYYVRKLLDISGESQGAAANSQVGSIPGMVRVSFGLYNVYSEIDLLLNTLQHVAEHKLRYIQRYGKLTKGHRVWYPDSI